MAINETEQMGWATSYYYISYDPAQFLSIVVADTPKHTFVIAPWQLPFTISGFCQFAILDSLRLARGT